MTAPLRILITNITLATRTGTETYVRDIAISLLRRGHAPFVYSPELGEMAHEIRAATVPVVDDLDALPVVPDVIHAHHHICAMTALLRFPKTPAVYLFHDSTAWHDIPPRAPRIGRYVAVDESCRDRLLVEHGVPEERLGLLLNFVDVERYAPRGPLPARPARAVVFSNYASESTHLGAVREACARSGLALDVIGARSGNSCSRPEEVLPRYDLVFAKAKCAIEALAVGAAVVVCDFRGVGPLVTTDNLDRLRRLNFGARTLVSPHRPEIIAREIARYDAADAAEVTRRVRAEATLQRTTDALEALYREVIDEQARAVRRSPDEESRATSGYLRDVTPRFQEWGRDAHRAAMAQAELGVARVEIEKLRARIDAIERSISWRLALRLRSSRVVRAVLGPVARLLAGRHLTPATDARPAS